VVGVRWAMGISYHSAERGRAMLAGCPEIFRTESADPPSEGGPRG
jgi:hypothetical protein